MPLTEPEIIDLNPALSTADILVSMGIPKDSAVRPRLRRLIEETVARATQRARPRLLWRAGTTEEVKASFTPSRRLTRYLASARSAAVVAGSIGPEWAAAISEETDPMRAYVYSAAGTALARQTLVQARRQLAQRHPEARIADSLSPGTDGLPFTLQAELAALLPLSSIGVEFDPEHGLLSPLASVSAMIAWGETVEREEPLPLCGETHHDAATAPPALPASRRSVCRRRPPS